MCCYCVPLKGWHTLPQRWLHFSRGDWDCLPILPYCQDSYCSTGAGIPQPCSIAAAGCSCTLLNWAISIVQVQWPLPLGRSGCVCPLLVGLGVTGESRRRLLRPAQSRSNEWWVPTPFSSLSLNRLANPSLQVCGTSLARLHTASLSPRCSYPGLTTQHRLSRERPRAVGLAGFGSPLWALQPGARGHKAAQVWPGHHSIIMMEGWLGQSCMSGAVTWCARSQHLNVGS